MAFVYTNPYKQPYLAAQQELEQRLKELEALQQRIAWLQASISALDPLANAEAVAPPSYGNIADLCCAVLSANPGKPMPVPEILHVIRLMGVKLKYSNSLAVIHTTLRRLASKPNSPVLIAPTGPNSGPLYVWDAKVPAPPRGPFLKEM